MGNSSRATFLDETHLPEGTETGEAAARFWCVRQTVLDKVHDHDRV